MEDVAMRKTISSSLAAASKDRRRMLWNSRQSDRFSSFGKIEGIIGK
jgi:hypothetical protein